MNWKSHFNNSTNPSGHLKPMMQTNSNIRRRCTQVSLASCQTRTQSRIELDRRSSLTISQTLMMQSALKIRYPSRSVINHNLKLVKTMLATCRSSLWIRPLLKNQNLLFSEVSQHRHIPVKVVHSLDVFKLTHKYQIQNKQIKNLKQKIRIILCLMTRTSSNTYKIRINSRYLSRRSHPIQSSSRK